MFILSSNAQTKFTDNLNTTVNYHSGFSIPEYPFLAAINNDYIRSLDVSFSKETSKGGPWEQLFNYPSYGLSLFYSTLGNKEILGNEFAANYFFKVNLIDKAKFILFNQIGIGLNYVNKKFDFDDNHLNRAVGSHVNIHFNIRLGTTFRLSEKVGLNAGISFDHFSNANTRDPNLGINYLTVYSGLNYLIGKKLDRKMDSITAHTPKNTLAIYGNMGGKLAKGVFSEYIMTTSLSAEVNRELFRSFHIGAGLDFFYDSSIENQLKENGEQFNKQDSFQTGIHISQTLAYNRFKLILQEGVYIFLPNKASKKPIYNKGIVQYHITKHFAVRVSMKAHLHILDYPEIGVGFTF